MSAVIKEYEERIAHFLELKVKFEAEFNKYSLYRLLSFLLLLLFVGLGVFQNQNELIFFGLSFVSLLIFASFIRKHNKIEEKLIFATEMHEINLEGLARLDRNWRLIPEINLPEYDDMTIAQDLGLFGKASLFQLICRANTILGRSRLASWLIKRSTSEEIKERKGAIVDLSLDFNSLQTFQFLGRRLGKYPPNMDLFLDWAEEEKTIKDMGLLQVVRFISPAFFIVSVFTSYFGMSHPYFWVIPIIFNIFVSRFFEARLTHIFDGIVASEKSFMQYSELFAWISEQEFKDNYLNELKNRLRLAGNDPHKDMKNLNKILTLVSLRNSEMMHSPFQLTVLWDFHIVVMLCSWRKRVGHKVREWMQVLAEFEALASLANYHYDHPDYCFAEEAMEYDTPLEGRELGHPLIPAISCIKNSFVVKKNQPLTLVTGSNMSGKSTLLRSIGVNVSLAQAGAPVCASYFSIPSIEMGTSFRVRDSLEDGVSYFLAELRQIATVVNLSKEIKKNNDVATPQNKVRLLYLLDEILLGTNIEERQIAVIHIVRTLIEQEAIGFISTHDMGLTEVEDIKNACHSVHFTENFSRKETELSMSFDYKLKEGPATSRNALKLLEMVGLGTIET